MSLLFDENLSFKLASTISSSFPRSLHVRDVGLMRADDLAVWQYAGTNGFAIVTLDSDFYDLSLVRGSPPKIVWLRSFDTSTSAMRELLVSRTSEIERFLADPSAACLILRP